MADMEAVEATPDDPGCGCCRPEPKTTQDVIRDLQARRENLDRRLARLEPGSVPERQLVGSGR